jgi:hypothetical protein
MQKLKPVLVAAILFVAGLLVGTFGGELVGDEDEDDEGRTGQKYDDPYVVDIDPADFVSVIDNTYFPLTPGTTLVYEAQAEDGLERIEFTVTHDTKVVMDVTCVVVHDIVTLDGTLIEDTYDWYAQDLDGNVWYFGEDSKDYEDGKFVGTGGSWEAVVDGALPGIMMFARPYIGVTYRQEFYKGEAEDMGTVLAIDGEAQVPTGNYADCLVIKDFNPLDMETIEHKYYAPGIGVVLERQVKGGSERVELIEVRTA